MYLISRGSTWAPLEKRALNGSAEARARNEITIADPRPGAETRNARARRRWEHSRHAPTITSVAGGGLDSAQVFKSALPGAVRKASFGASDCGTNGIGHVLFSIVRANVENMALEIIFKFVS